MVVVTLYYVVSQVYEGKAYDNGGGYELWQLLMSYCCGPV